MESVLREIRQVYTVIHEVLKNVKHQVAAIANLNNELAAMDKRLSNIEKMIEKLDKKS
jgi:DNA repair ATPase RecN